MATQEGRRYDGFIGIVDSVAQELFLHVLDGTNGQRRLDADEWLVETIDPSETSMTRHGTPSISSTMPLPLVALQEFERLYPERVEDGRFSRDDTLAVFEAVRHYLEGEKAAAGERG